MSINIHTMERTEHQTSGSRNPRTLSFRFNLGNDFKVLDVECIGPSSSNQVVESYSYEPSQGIFQVAVRNVEHYTLAVEETTYMYLRRTNIQEIGDMVYWTCLYESNKTVNGSGPKGGAMPCSSTYVERSTLYYFRATIKITYRELHSGHLETIVAGVPMESDEILVLKDGVWSTVEQVFGFRDEEWVEGKKS